MRCRKSKRAGPRGATGRRGRWRRSDASPKPMHCSPRCPTNSIFTASSRPRNWASPSAPCRRPGTPTRTTSRKSPQTPPCNARWRSTRRACATKARWNGSGRSRTTTTRNYWPRRNWRTTTNGTSAPSTRPSARCCCTISDCAIPRPIATWSRSTAASSIWTRPGSTAWYGRKAGSCPPRGRPPAPAA